MHAMMVNCPKSVASKNSRAKRRMSSSFQRWERNPSTFHTMVNTALVSSTTKIDWMWPSAVQGMYYMSVIEHKNHSDLLIVFRSQSNSHHHWQPTCFEVGRKLAANHVRLLHQWNIFRLWNTEISTRAIRISLNSRTKWNLKKTFFFHFFIHIFC